MKSIHNPYRINYNCEMSDVAPILKLNTDCCDELFAYLSFEDLQLLGQTCKALLNVTGKYFQKHYASTPKFMESDGVCMPYNLEDQSRLIYIAPLFYRFLKYIKHRYPDLGSIAYHQNHAHAFESLTEILFSRYELNRDFVASMQSVLPKINVLWVCGTRNEGDLYEDLLQFCGNLKELHVGLEVDIPDPQKAIKRQGPNSWMLREYPSLEWFSLTGMSIFHVNELSIFLARNPSIQKFTTEAGFLFECRLELLKSNIRLDKLEVSDIFRETVPAFCELLNQLYDRGFYKHLNITINIAQEVIDNFATLCGFDELHICDIEGKCDFSRLNHLKSLELSDYYDNSSHVIELATSLTNLQYLQFGEAKFNDILPFIQQSKRLKSIEVHSFQGDMDLVKLNTERENLPEAHKVIIYVSDYVFLATKWSIRNGDTNLSKVELRRSSFYFFFQ